MEELINKEIEMAKKDWDGDGMKYTEEGWREAKRDTTGLPWYKNPAMRESARQGG